MMNAVLSFAADGTVFVRTTFGDECVIGSGKTIAEACTELRQLVGFTYPEFLNATIHIVGGL